MALYNVVLVRCLYTELQVQKLQVITCAHIYVTISWHGLMVEFIRIDTITFIRRVIIIIIITSTSDLQPRTAIVNQLPGQ